MAKLSMSAKVFLGFGVGVVLGLIFQDKILFLQPVGDLFLKLIQMIVMPLIFCSIISGIASIGDVAKLKRIGTKVMGFYVVTTILSTIIGLAVSHLLQPGRGFGVGSIVESAENVKAAEPLSVGAAILGMVPSNPLEALAKGDLMQTIVFAVFVGVALTILGDKASNFKKVIDEGSQVMFKITDIVMKTTPYGVCALAACSIGEYGLAVFGIMGKFILTHYVAALSIVIFLYLFIIRGIARIPLADFFRKVSEIWWVAFSTTSSSGTLPVTLKVVEQKFHVRHELASFTLPLGATINMNGIAAYYAVTVLFVSQIYGVDLTLYQQAAFIFMTTLISIGTPGIPNSGIVLTVMLLGTMGLPAAIMGMIVGIFRPIDMVHTALNVTGDVVSTLAVARLEDMYEDGTDTQLEEPYGEEQRV
ncbi:putative sodium:dicarboxylate symporter [Selenomonas ruminantium subsp. lactilytica TAM6421]|uniref:Putative sodium:dicarboxylate symporter n=1 Tax=Selenomonas ruminantium subsp. lactilytica (strain NBRC 103574 / TAM6421) TaxID=927704 RepID=I0GUN4_SELRL|nr:dicarboxylate/amino acid:cation symporter [Selenomonas ruminantium]BAL84471.1 putative sodium:dicarboxylate symporter [Selenomonas ruminantium subsp. lactilytica TAM6421]